MSRPLLVLLLATLAGAAWARTPAPASRRAVIDEQAVEVSGRTWRRVRLRALAEDGRRLAEGIVWLWSPPDPIGFALALPGWKLPVMDSARETSLTAVAEAHRLALVLAEMHTTVYETRFYPASRRSRKWCGADCEMGGLTWLAEVVLPFGRSRYGDVVGALGLSTGGRGAVSVAQRIAPGLPVCSASGTFDLFALSEGTGEYRIHAQVFGERARWAARWAAHDNLRRVADGVRSPMLLVHGGRDASVPSDQSRALADAMSRAGGVVTLDIVPDAGHDWRLWAEAMPRCLAFIAGQRARGAGGSPGGAVRGGIRDGTNDGYRDGTGEGIRDGTNDGIRDDTGDGITMPLDAHSAPCDEGGITHPGAQPCSSRPSPSPPPSSP